MVAHACNPSIWEAEAGGFLSSRPGLQSEFQDSQSYTEKPCLKKKTKTKTKKQKQKTTTKINKQTNKNKEIRESLSSLGLKSILIASGS